MRFKYHQLQANQYINFQFVINSVIQLFLAFRSALNSATSRFPFYASSILYSTMSRGGCDVFESRAQVISIFPLIILQHIERFMLKCFMALLSLNKRLLCLNLTKIILHESENQFSPRSTLFISLSRPPHHEKGKDPKDPENCLFINHRN